MFLNVDISVEQLAAVCQRYGVLRVWLFGSVLREDFAQDSDIDVLVEFTPESRPKLATLIALEAEFEQIFQRKVDLGEYEAVMEDPNFIRRHHILNSAQVIYER
jgi:predicted nucleotidyltransferase